MALRDRVIEVLKKWCGTDAVDRTDEKMEDLWNRTTFGLSAPHAHAADAGGLSFGYS